MPLGQGHAGKQGAEHREATHRLFHFRQIRLRCTGTMVGFLPPFSEHSRSSDLMDADTLGLACALADMAIYKLADLVELAREGVLNELILTAVELQNLEQRAAEAVTLQSSLACRRAAQLSQADARAAEAERRQAEAEAKCAAAEARGPVALHLQVHPQLHRGDIVATW